MKILILYYSQTGNTEKVAKRIFYALPSVEKALKKINELDYEQIKNCEIIFLGSPVHIHTLPKKVKVFFKKIPRDYHPNIALFITYGVQLEQFYKGAIDITEYYCKNYSLNFLGAYHCLGKHNNLKEFSKIFPDKVDWVRKTSEGHPDESDLKKAEDWALKIFEVVKK